MLVKFADNCQMLCMAIDSNDLPVATPDLLQHCSEMGAVIQNPSEPGTWLYCIQWPNQASAGTYTAAEVAAINGE